MTGVFGGHTDSHVTVEAEIGMTQLQTKEHELTATPEFRKNPGSHKLLEFLTEPGHFNSFFVASRTLRINFFFKNTSFIVFYYNIPSQLVPPDGR